MAKRKGGGPNYLVGLAVLAVVGAALYGGWQAKDRWERSRAQAAAEAEWAKVRARVDARLNDQFPLYFGAVWATHSGRVCGLVDGGSSFGGLTGMIPFFADGDAVRFSADSEPKAFAAGWRECMQDTWLELHKGSYETGFCATPRGATRCKLVGG